MPFYRKIPMFISAWQVPLPHEEPSQHIMALVALNKWEADVGGVTITNRDGSTMLAHPGDFIIRDDDDNHYSCHPQLFFSTFERIDTNA